MAPQGEAYNVDWVWSSVSNVHACNHRDWFITFTPFKSRGGSYLRNAGVDIEGIGDVELEVRRVPDNRSQISGPRSSKIVLRDVAYCPGATCNIIGRPITEDLDVSTDDRPGGCGSLREKGSGRLVGLLDHSRLHKLLLKGQSRGLSSLDRDAVYLIRIMWPASEVQRWQAEAETAPYTAEEKEWLQGHYRGEFHFLRTLGLSIYKEDDREEGRSIARAMMLGDDRHADEEEEEEEEEVDSEDSRTSFERELEEDPMSHLADYAFDEDQLDWIKAHYRHSANFLLSHGLKPFDGDDCEEGARLARGLMDGD
ncbi:hypothetical protein Tdes44962_MAKER09901 [Teratosphaeria destructans]|uniref:Retrovirus-related Pol polyprotein from transposon TNT 1-94-like beta-barrel domain-containing protein n=1 Tax=Teratosphaeria destructans TaxID=418781 RepID=A0A9W7W223_9PEZI|nr:hypothetical protein Tdes44962_MAKER09901 [Teratosphaeria destructans]